MGPDFALLVAGENRIESALSTVEGKPSSLFFMHSGVKALADARLDRLISDGHEVTVCASDAEAHGFHPREGGARFGSQYEHAQLVRDARRLLALTPRGVVDSFPGDRTDRQVRVRLGSSPRTPEAAQALRSAVGYATLGLRVTIALENDALPLIAHLDHPPAILRALGTLRGLGCPVVPIAAAEAFDLMVSW